MCSLLRLSQQSQLSDLGFRDTAVRQDEFRMFRCERRAERIIRPLEEGRRDLLVDSGRMDLPTEKIPR